MSEPEPPAAPAAGRTPPPRQAAAGHARLTLIVVCVAVFMLLLDVTVVAVALASIQRDLGGDLSSLQWVVDAYALILAGLLLTAATLGDRIGRRRIFIAGLVIFTAASAGCAAAWSPASLDLLRGAQGIGGALLFGTALPLLGAAFPDPRGRARAIAAFGTSLTAATAIGPLVGGVLVDGAGWRWIFLVNLPIGAAVLLAALRVSESRAPAARRADWPGTGLLTAGLLALLLALIRGNADGWTSARIMALFLAAAILLGAFGLREATAAEPMLDLRLFRHPGFTGVGLGAFAVSATLIAATTYLAIYLQNGLGYSPLASGVRVLPLTAAAFITAPLTASLLHRVPMWLLISVGLALSGIGLLLAANLNGTSHWTVLLPGFVIAGAGLGVTSAASSAAALAAVPASRAGMATGAVNTMRQVGTAAGVAGLGALFQHSASHQAATLLAAVPAPLRSQLAAAVGAGAGARIGGTVPGPAGAIIAAAGRTASATGLSQLLLAGGIIALAATVACALLIRAQPAPASPADHATAPAQPVSDAKTAAGA